MADNGKSKETRDNWKNALGLTVLGLGIAVACIACLPAAGVVVAGIYVSGTVLATTTAVASGTAIVAATAKAGLHVYDSEYEEAALSLADAIPFVGTLNASMTQLRLGGATYGKGQTGASGAKSNTSSSTSNSTGSGTSNSTGGAGGNPPKGSEGKTYQTYTKTNAETGEVYTGRTSGTGSPQQNVRSRDSNHHMNDRGYGPAVIDKSSSNPQAIRGREQQLIDAHGGAKSAGGTSGNAIRGISDTNPKKDIYMDAAKKEFGK